MLKHEETHGNLKTHRIYVGTIFLGKQVHKCLSKRHRRYCEDVPVCVCVFEALYFVIEDRTRTCPDLSCKGTDGSCSLIMSLNATTVVKCEYLFCCVVVRVDQTRNTYVRRTTCNRSESSWIGSSQNAVKLEFESSSQTE